MGSGTGWFRDLEFGLGPQARDLRIESSRVFAVYLIRVSGF